RAHAPALGHIGARARIPRTSPELFCTKCSFVIRKPLLNPIRCLSKFYLCIFKPWHGSTDDKEHIGSNGSAIGARTRELGPLQVRD
ncbi:hypothetical protein LINPERPRIM_LOCUS38161, partial [Linum perenne]